MSQTVSFTKTLRFKVKPESYAWLNKAAIEVNQVWNWANATSLKAARPFYGEPKWLSGYDLCSLSAGASAEFERIGADTIQLVNGELATRRRQFKKTKLRWRVSRGARRSLGWVPFKAANLKRKGKGLRFCGKTFRVFEAHRLDSVKWKQGCFVEDSLGDWYLCLPVEQHAELDAAPKEAVGIDLGLKTIAATSDGDELEAGRFYRGIEHHIAQAQRRGHKRQAKRLYRKAVNRRKDALHKFSRKLVNEYQTIVIGDVSSPKLAKTRMAKSVLDSGWGMLKQMVQFKGEHAGRSVEIVSERNTTRACSSCGSLSGPTGLDMLVVRQWQCRGCGVTHDRDQNAARNILSAGLRCRASVGGNTLLSAQVPSSSAPSARETGTETARATV